MLALPVTAWLTSWVVVGLVGLTGVALLLTDIVRRESAKEVALVYRASGALTTAVFIGFVALRFYVLAG